MPRRAALAAPRLRRSRRAAALALTLAIAVCAFGLRLRRAECCSMLFPPAFTAANQKVSAKLIFFVPSPSKPRKPRLICYQC